MIINNYDLFDLTAILYLILGISNLFAGKYLAGIAWISLSLSQFIIQRIESWPSNMFRWEQTEVILAWITYLIFTILILTSLIKLLIN